MSIDKKRKTEPLCRIRDIYRMINDFEGVLQKNFKVGLNEGMLLCSLYTFGECSSGKVAELLGLTLSNSSKVIISAEKKGLVKRISGEVDKRQMIFKLTAEGEKCIEAIKRDSDNILELITKIREI